MLNSNAFGLHCGSDAHEMPCFSPLHVGVSGHPRWFWTSCGLDAAVLRCTPRPQDPMITAITVDHNWPVATKVQSKGHPKITQHFVSLCIPLEEVHNVAGRQSEQANKGKRVRLQTVSSPENRWQIIIRFSRTGTGYRASAAERQSWRSGGWQQERGWLREPALMWGAGDSGEQVSGAVGFLKKSTEAEVSVGSGLESWLTA